jgi:hypothetical protein
MLSLRSKERSHRLVQRDHRGAFWQYLTSARGRDLDFDHDEPGRLCRRGTGNAVYRACGWRGLRRLELRDPHLEREFRCCSLTSPPISTARVRRVSTSPASFPSNRISGAGDSAPDAAAATAYDPSKARFSAPFFGAFSAADSITLGNRVKSDRERIINGGLAGNALILQGTYITSRITGYGRSSWYREIVDEANGIAGPKAGVSDGGFWYYWSPQGPMRIAAAAEAEATRRAREGSCCIGGQSREGRRGRDIATNSFSSCSTPDPASGTKASYHVRRNIWTTASDDVGLGNKGSRRSRANHVVYRSRCHAAFGPAHHVRARPVSAEA